MRILKGVWILSLILLIPIAILTLLLGVPVGLIGFAAALPLSAHLSGLLPLGADLGEVWVRVLSQARLHALSAVAAVFFALNTMALLPGATSSVALLPLVITSFFALSLYVIAVKGGSVRAIPAQIGPPLLGLAVASLLLL
jgi:hypothetical protein